MPKQLKQKHNLVHYTPHCNSTLITVVFLKSRSPRLKMAVRIAEGADRYDVDIQDGQEVHIVRFGQSKIQAQRALSMLRFIWRFKGTQVFMGSYGLTTESHAVSMLRCYISASAHKNPKRYCTAMVEDPKDRRRYDRQHIAALEKYFKLHPEAAKKMNLNNISDFGPAISEFLEFLEPVKHVPCKCKKAAAFIKNETGSIDERVETVGIERGLDACPLFNLPATNARLLP